VPMLQLLCNTSIKANSFNANTSMSTRFFIYANPIMVMHHNNVIVIVNGPVLRISQKIQ